MYLCFYLINKVKRRLLINYGVIILDSPCVQKDLYKFMIMQHFGKEWVLGFFFNQTLYIGNGKP